MFEMYLSLALSFSLCNRFHLNYQQSTGWNVFANSSSNLVSSSRLRHQWLFFSFFLFFSCPSVITSALLPDIFISISHLVFFFFAFHCKLRTTLLLTGRNICFSFSLQFRVSSSHWVYSELAVTSWVVLLIPLLNLMFFREKEKEKLFQRICFFTVITFRHKYHEVTKLKEKRDR